MRRNPQPARRLHLLAAVLAAAALLVALTGTTSAKDLAALLPSGTPLRPVGSHAAPFIHPA